MSRPTCETCRWWDHVEDEFARFGDCRAKSPRFMGDSDYAPWQLETAERERFRIWPLVYSDDFCGEHTPREGKPE